MFSLFGTQKQRIYLDTAAATKLAPEVILAMRPYLEEHFGNPSAIYMEGRTAHAAVERARAQIAQLISASPELLAACRIMASVLMGFTSAELVSRVAEIHGPTFDEGHEAIWVAINKAIRGVK